MIIGLCGLKGSGKDTIADYLCKNYNFTKLSFACSVKDIASIIFSWDRELLEGSTDESREFREKKDDWWSMNLGLDITPRKMLQFLGTDLFRNNFHPDIWLKIIERKIVDNPDRNIVITDCRFPNEHRLIKKYKGIMISVNRNNPAWFYDYKNKLIDSVEGVHSSELEWIRQIYDYEIKNDSTKKDLEEKILSLMNLLQI